MGCFCLNCDSDGGGEYGLWRWKKVEDEEIMVLEEMVEDEKVEDELF
jgi:hypothetical protein